MKQNRLTYSMLFLLFYAVTSEAEQAKKVDAVAIIEAFKANGLEAENPYEMSHKDYGIAPYLCHGTRFLIPSLGDGSGGRIYVCKNTEDAKRMATHYEDMAATSAIFFSWVIRKKNIVVQINGDLANELAARYREAMP